MRAVRADCIIRAQRSRHMKGLPMGRSNRFQTALMCALLLGGAPQQAAAQGYPNKPIRFLVGFPPGGTSDILARTLGQKMSEAWNVQVVVENRPGAAGNIAAEMVAK